MGRALHGWYLYSTTLDLISLKFINEKRILRAHINAGLDEEKNGLVYLLSKHQVGPFCLAILYT